MTPEEPPLNLDSAAAAPPLPERDPFWGYSDLLWFFGMAIVSVVASWAVEWLAQKLFKLEVAGVAAAMFVLYALLFGSLRVMFRVLYDRPFWRSLGWTPTRLPVMLWAIIFGMTTAVLVALASSLIHTPTGDNPMTRLLEPRVNVLVLGTLSVTLGPLCEELAFRGFLQPLLVRSLGAVPGIALAAAAFGLLHFEEYGNSWRHALIIALAGAAFGAMRHVTGSTKAAAIMHAAYNLMFFIALMTEKRILPRLW